jgi:methylthioribulose-1-phosphate dehydratase
MTATGLRADLLDALLPLARAYGDRGWTPATSGNYSVRDADGRICITRSGVDKRMLDRAGMMRLDADGTPESADDRPSAETGLHLQVYRQFPDARCVLHVHTVASTVLSRRCADAGAVELSGFEVAKAFPGVSGHETTLRIPVVPNDQDIQRLAASVAPWLAVEEPLPVYLIEGHGLYAWGRSVAEASRHLEAAEFLFQCHLEETRLRRPESR